MPVHVLLALAIDGDQISSRNNMKTILVTGGAGFLGTVIVQKLVGLVPQLRIIVLDKVDTGEKPSRQLQYHHADITVLKEVIKVFSATSPDAVIHTAGLIPSLSERYQRRLEKVVFDVNINGTKNVLEAAKGAGCKVFIYTSSCCAGQYAYP
jgi:sterol-4alpha-carboxylate 3-dehydrogenase (decarboxylating)